MHRLAGAEDADTGALEAVRQQVEAVADHADRLDAEEVLAGRDVDDQVPVEIVGGDLERAAGLGPFDQRLAVPGLKDMVEHQLIHRPPQPEAPHAGTGSSWRGR